MIHKTSHLKLVKQHELDGHSEPSLLKRRARSDERVVENTHTYTKYKNMKTHCTQISTL